MIGAALRHGAALKLNPKTVTLNGYDQADTHTA